MQKLWGLHFRDEAKRQPGKASFSKCCMSGKMEPILFNPAPYPPRMQQFFDDPHFLAEIRDYNTAMITQWELWLALGRPDLPSALKRPFFRTTKLDENELFVVHSMPIEVCIKMMFFNNNYFLCFYFCFST